MGELKKARMGIIAILALMLVSITRRLPEVRRLSSGTTTLALAGIVLLVAAGSASAEFACVADDGSGDAYFFGDTVMKSCTLNGSMSGSGSDGLRIGANDVVIEGYNATQGKYFKITGDNTLYTIGIHNYDAGNGVHGGGYHNVVIRNLDISGFAYGDGIRVRGTMNPSPAQCLQKVENNTIHNCTVHDNSEGFGINCWQCVCNSTIDNCTVYNTTGTLSNNCDDPGAGIRLWGKSSHNDVTSNEAYHNDLAGIYSKKGCQHNHIFNNTVYDNGKVDSGAEYSGGIRFQCKSTHWNIFENNTVWGNFGPGIFFGGCNCTARNNSVTDNKQAKPTNRGDGIWVDRYPGGGEDTKLYDNTFCNNEHLDINVQNAAQVVTGDNNTCDTTSNYDDNGTIGCTYSCGPAGIFACVADDGSGDAYFFGDTVMKSCTLNGSMSGSGSDGLRIGANGVVIEGYNATQGKYFGITGDNTPYTIGIHNYDAGNGVHGGGYHNVVIRNLDISGFAYGDGIRVRGTMNLPSPQCLQKVENNTIHNCTVHDNSEGFGINCWQCVCNSTIDRCIVYNTTGTLIGSCDDPGVGIRLWGKSNYNDVTNNTVHHNDLAGIYSNGGCQHNYIFNNTVYENGQTDTNADFTGGIRFHCTSTHWTIVENNTVWGNFGPGIFFGGRNCTARNNSVTDNKQAKPTNRGDGIWVDRYPGGGDDTTLYDNTFCNNEHLDINVQSAAQVVTGDNNTCDTASNYCDDSAGCPPACVFQCTGPQEQPDLTIEDIRAIGWCCCCITLRDDGKEKTSKEPSSVSALFLEDPEMAEELGDEKLRKQVAEVLEKDPKQAAEIAVKLAGGDPKALAKFTIDKDESITEEKLLSNPELVDIKCVCRCCCCCGNCFNLMPELADLLDAELTHDQQHEMSDLLDQIQHGCNCCCGRFIIYNITNEGDEDAGFSLSNLTVDGHVRSVDIVRPLDAGQHRWEIFPCYRMCCWWWHGPYPIHEVKVCADVTDWVAESNENNNCRTEWLP